MQSKKIFFFLILLISFCHYTVQAQAKFSAKISPASIGKNETAELRLIVENARQVEQINPPSLKDFIIISGPSQESGMVSINGNTKQYTGITYLLKPKAKGHFIIAAATAKADGKILQSNPVSLQVNNTASGNSQNTSVFPFAGLLPFKEPAPETSFKDFILKKGENVQEKINKNIFIKVDVSKTSVYIGEPVLVTYKLYTRLKSESNIVKSPSFNGFSVVDMEEQGNNISTVEKLNGREYNVYILRRSQLYPLQAGDIELESAEVENNIHFIKEEFADNQRGLDLFGDLAQAPLPAEAMHNEKITLQSKPVTITVKPLPVANKPVSFKGAVGNFTVTSVVEKNSFTTADAGKLKIMIAGEGNMTLITAPGIVWPDGIETYEQKTNDELNKLTVPVSGIKKFEYPFTVSKPGNYTLPPVEFSFFDPKESKYKTVTTKLLAIIVTKGTGKSASPILSNQGNTKAGKEQFFDWLFTNRLWIMTPVALLIITGLLFWVKKENKKQIEHYPAKIETTDSLIINNMQPPVNSLTETEEKLVQQDTKGFYEALNKEFHTFLAGALQLPVETITKKSIAEEADKKEISVSISLQIQQLLDEIEWQLYTPYAEENKMPDMYTRAKAIMQAFNNIGAVKFQ